MKAVIMAGGEGERMRPLTCTVPKPMLRLCGKPTIYYILELLYNNGCTEVIVSLRYLSEEVIEYLKEESGLKWGNMKISWVEEKEKLGTAGGVKLAAKSFDEPFLVISGDAICDFDLKHFMSLHGSSNNEVSILLTKVKDPREYGLVTLTKLSKIESFIEKPGWGRAVSDLANTGIYFINPGVLSYIPDGIPYDFSKDLFPKMMKEGKIIGGFEEKGYWSDIGDFRSYIVTQTHMMQKRVKTPLNVSETLVCSNDGRIPGGRYKIIPPVYIGDRVIIGDDSIIGPGSVIDDGCVIGSNVHVKNSIVLQNAKLENNSRLTGTIIAGNGTVKNGAQLFSLSVLGENSILGEKSTVLQNVLIWPGKEIPSLVRVCDNVVEQALSFDIFDDGGVKGSADAELRPELCAKLGRACASIKQGIKLGIATDGTRCAKVLKMALVSGAMASGAYLWDFGEAFAAQMPFFSSFCGLDLGIFIKTADEKGGNEAVLMFCGPDGLPLSRIHERDIEKRIQKSDFSRANINKGRDISSITSIRMIYSQELCRVAKSDLSGIGVSIESDNPEVSRVLRECLDRVGATYSDDLTVKIDSDGTDFVMSERKYPKTSSEVLLAICCNNEFRLGRDVALPTNAPHMIDDIAKMYGRRVLRYFDSPTDSSDEQARRLAMCQSWSNDALFMTMKILRIMHDRKKPLHELVDEIPKFYRCNRELAINFSPVKLKDIFSDDFLNPNVAFASEGISLLDTKNGARAMVKPSKKGDRLTILTEGSSVEAAEEFALDISQKIVSEIYPQPLT